MTAGAGRKCGGAGEAYGAKAYAGAVLTAGVDEARDVTTESYQTESAEETHALGVRLGREAEPGTILTLDGDLGAGKTVLAQGIAEGLGITEPVNSPTFTILQVYEGGRLPLYHFDVYRIEEPEEMAEIGLDEYLYGDGVCVIEWATQIEALLPPERVRLTLEREDARGADCRRIRLERLG